LENALYISTGRSALLDRLASDTRDMGLLRLEHVSKDYVTDGASVHALRDVSLEVARGEFVALVGRSGCGKSTLLNLAGCMDFPTSGNVILEGVTTSSLNELELTRLRRQKVGFIFQSFQLLPTLSVVENVELPLMLAGRPDARGRALECLRWVEMEHFGERRPFQLSGGEMQRVGIARALVHSPSLLLADEPTGNLDTGTSALILGILRRVSDEKKTTILMATHSSEAAATADTIIRLRDGSIEGSIRQAKGIY
jgi:putative ABC transport system ATP-binding protein